MYAINGLKDLIKTETSFKIELLIVFILLPIVFILNISYTDQILLIISLLGILVAEATNSAIERVVDLVTLEHHTMAGRAKDVGSTIVFLSITIFVIIWCIILYHYFI